MMRRFILIMMLVFPFLMTSQQVEMKTGHVIKVDSEETELFLERYIEKLQEFPIEFEEALMEIDEVKVSKDLSRENVGEYINKKIYLNPRLEDYPYTKKAVILHYILVNNGLKLKDTSYPHVMNESIDLDKRTEASFKMQFKNEAILGWVVRVLKEESPLKSKL